MLDAILDGPLMKEVLAVMPEEFVDPQLSDGIFEVTGFRMNDFEMSIFTVFSRLTTRSQMLMKLIEAKEVSFAEIGKAKSEVEILHDKAKMLIHLMYFSIQNRLDLWACNLGVSKGGKIIHPDTEFEKEKKITVIKKLINGIFSSYSKETEGTTPEEILRRFDETNAPVN